MVRTDFDPNAAWADALTAAALLAIDPAGLGGALLRARCGAQRDHWLACLRAVMPSHLPLRRVPINIADERLLGGLDLAATLQHGRPVAQRGVLADCDGGLVLLAMAERLNPATAARLTAVLDRGEVLVERDGLTLRLRARIGLVALDEGADDDEQAPAALADRLAFHLTLDELPARGLAQTVDTVANTAASTATSTAASTADIKAAITAAITAADVADARARLPGVASGADTAAALCQAALALGIGSLRAPWLALRAACAVAALHGHDQVTPDDAALAARLVLAPRATRLPAPPEPDAEADTDANATPPPPDPAPPPPPADPADPADPATHAAPVPPPPDPAAAGAAPPANGANTASPPPPPPPPADTPLSEVVLDAATSALPPGLLARLKAGLGARGAASAGGRSGALQASGLRGRPLGARRGELRSGSRLDLIATLRAAAPWQVLRRREAAAQASAAASHRASAGPAPASTRPGAAASAARTGRPAIAIAIATAATATAIATAAATATATAAAATVVPATTPAPRVRDGHEALQNGAREVPPAPAPASRVLVRREDFHIARRAQRRETTTVFVVDASGSAALARLAEAKGAVELLLADCYVRRDRVALLAFRGHSAELVLPPTRSLVRAKRALAGLPGGGGTPLASALDAAVLLTGTIQRRGGTPLLVLLTDARANIARNGQPGREQALADAISSARRLRAAGIGALLVDTSAVARRASGAAPGVAGGVVAGAAPSAARQVADAMAALYLPLPQVSAAGLSQLVRTLGATRQTPR